MLKHPESAYCGYLLVEGTPGLVLPISQSGTAILTPSPRRRGRNQPTNPRPQIHLIAFPYLSSPVVTPPDSCPRSGHPHRQSQLPFLIIMMMIIVVQIPAFNPPERSCPTSQPVDSERYLPHRTVRTSPSSIGLTPERLSIGVQANQ